MGGDEGLRRLALGLSNTEHPDWDALQDTYERVDPATIEDLPQKYASAAIYRHRNPSPDNPVSNVLFDSKGRPFLPTHDRDVEIANDAMDEAMKVIVMHERNAAEAIRRAQLDKTEQQQAKHRVPFKRLLMRALPPLFNFSREVVGYYSNSLAAGLVVSKSYSRLPFTELILRQLQLTSPLWAATNVVITYASHPAVLRMCSFLFSPLVHGCEKYGMTVAFLSYDSLRELAMTPNNVLTGLNDMRLLDILYKTKRTHPRDPTSLFKAIMACVSSMACSAALTLSSTGLALLQFRTPERSGQAFEQFAWVREHFLRFYRPFKFIPEVFNSAINFVIGGGDKDTPGRVPEMERLTAPMLFPASHLRGALETIFVRAATLPMHMIGLRLLMRASGHLLRALGAPAQAALLEADAFAPFQILPERGDFKGLFAHVAKVGLFVTLETAGCLLTYGLSLALGPVREVDSQSDSDDELD